MATKPEWIKAPNTCPAASCAHCGNRIKLGRECLTRTTQTSVFRGDDVVEWCHVECLPHLVASRVKP